MSMRKLSLALVVVLAACGAIFAQDTGTGNNPGQTQNGMGRGRRGEGDHMMMGPMRILRQLTLSDVEKQQVQAILQKYGDATKPQREEMRKLHEESKTTPPSDANKARMEELRTELRQSNANLRTEILNVLTPDNRTKFETIEQQMKNERKEKRDGGQ